MTIYDDSDKIIYTSINNSNNKARIAKINDYRYTAIKPPIPMVNKLKNLLSSFTHKELFEAMYSIILNKTDSIDTFNQSL